MSLLNRVRCECTIAAPTGDYVTGEIIFGAAVAGFRTFALGDEHVSPVLNAAYPYLIESSTGSWETGYIHTDENGVPTVNPALTGYRTVTGSSEFFTPSDADLVFSVVSLATDLFATYPTNSPVAPNAQGVASMAIGDHANAGAGPANEWNYSMAIGVYATAKPNSATAIGAMATAAAPNSVAIGHNASVGLGNDPVCTSVWVDGGIPSGVAIGGAAQVEYGGIAIGGPTLSWGKEGIAIGRSAQAMGDYAIAIGSNAGVMMMSGYDAIAIGRDTRADYPESQMMGTASGNHTFSVPLTWSTAWDAGPLPHPIGEGLTYLFDYMNGNSAVLGPRLVHVVARFIALEGSDPDANLRPTYIHCAEYDVINRYEAYETVLTLVGTPVITSSGGVVTMTIDSTTGLPSFAVSAGVVNIGGTITLQVSNHYIGV